MNDDVTIELQQYIRSVDDGSFYPICGFIPKELNYPKSSRWIYNGNEITVMIPPFDMCDVNIFFEIWKESRLQKLSKKELIDIIKSKKETNNIFNTFREIDYGYVNGYPIKYGGID